ncbi:hypothetical protein [Gelidibacter algens]|uniref:hypothetical protein n=1 Tax=Gelidibacter algens TaxID=49280 RepID=UPI0012F72799|nr:hypothetical protein [Gelidibacter algens]
MFGENAIEELTEEWEEEDSPFVTIAKQCIPKQAVPADGHFQVMENLSLTINQIKNN